MSARAEQGSASKRLTLITTTYRSARYIASYCEGVVGSDNLREIEALLVMNDPDADETRVVSDYCGRYPGVFRVLEVARESIGASINRGLLAATTPYCAFLDVDDLRPPDALRRQMGVLDADPGVDFTYGDFMVVPKQGATEGRYVRTIEFERYEFTRSCLASPTQMLRRSLIDSIGGFDEQFVSGGDFDFQIRAALACSFARTPGLLLYRTQYPGSGSASSSRLQPLERTAIELRYGLYDKTIELEGFAFLEEARDYRLGEMLFRGAWHPLSKFVAGYDDLLASRASGLEALERHAGSWRRQRLWRRLSGVALLEAIRTRWRRHRAARRARRRSAAG